MRAARLAALPSLSLAALVAGVVMASAPARAALSYDTIDVMLSSTTGEAPQKIPAQLLRPEGTGPFPAIVVAHDCSGLGPHSSGAPGRWGKLLAGQGYVIILPDSFTLRGLPDGVCAASVTREQRATASIGTRMRDAYAALAYLRTLAYVDGKRVGIMGGSHGGSTTLAAMVDPGNGIGAVADAKRNGFAAGIALYPGCGARYGEWNVERRNGFPGPVTGFVGVYKPIAPLLILIGEKDDWTPAEHCEAMAARARKAGYPVEIKVYPGAQHSFDSSFPVRYLGSRNNINKADGRGATTGGDSDAWADSIKEVEAFFAAHLKARP